MSVILELVGRKICLHWYDFRALFSWTVNLVFSKWMPAGVWSCHTRMSWGKEDWKRRSLWSVKDGVREERETATSVLQQNWGWDWVDWIWKSRQRGEDLLIYIFQSHLIFLSTDLSNNRLGKRDWVFFLPGSVDGKYAACTTHSWLSSVWSSLLNWQEGLCSRSPSRGWWPVAKAPWSRRCRREVMPVSQSLSDSDDELKVILSLASHDISAEITLASLGPVHGACEPALFFWLCGQNKPWFTGPVCGLQDQSVCWWLLSSHGARVQP